MSRTSNLAQHCVAVYLGQETILLGAPHAAVAEQHLQGKQVMRPSASWHSPVQACCMKGCLTRRGADSGDAIERGGQSVVVRPCLTRSEVVLIDGGVIIEHGRWAESCSHGSRPLIPVRCVGSLHSSIQIVLSYACPLRLRRSAQSGLQIRLVGLKTLCGNHC